MRQYIFEDKGKIIIITANNIKLAKKQVSLSAKLKKVIEL